MPYGKGLLKALDMFAWAEMFAALDEAKGFDDETKELRERLGRGTQAIAAFATIIMYEPWLVCQPISYMYEGNYPRMWQCSWPSAQN